MNCCTVFALAAILRFLTPIEAKAPSNGIYRGWLDGSQRGGSDEIKSEKEDTVTYADGLSYNLKEGWYEFRCSCKVASSSADNNLTPLPELLGSFDSPQQPNTYEEVIRSYLIKNDGGDLSRVASNPTTKHYFDKLVKSVSTLYARMVAGDGMLNILKEMSTKQGMFEEDGFASSFGKLNDSVSIHTKRPLHYRPSPIPDGSSLLHAKIGNTDEEIRSVVFSEVASVSIIDLHTHLLPPSHGALCLWGIDELLTYVCGDLLLMFLRIWKFSNICFFFPFANSFLHI